VVRVEIGWGRRWIGEAGNRFLLGTCFPARVASYVDRVLGSRVVRSIYGYWCGESSGSYWLGFVRGVMWGERNVGLAGSRAAARSGTQRAGGGKGIRPRHVGYVAGFSFFRVPYFLFGGFRGAARPDAARRGDVVARGSRFARDAGAPPRRATRVIWSRWTSAGRRYKSFLRPLQFWITTEGIQ
jgi:hypothetical protein